jgi:hypothetical protein
MAGRANPASETMTTTAAEWDRFIVTPRTYGNFEVQASFAQLFAAHGWLKFCGSAQLLFIGTIV